MSEATEQIMQVIIRSPNCSLDEIVFECQSLTWNQVFSELDRLSRTGQIRLKMKAPGLYTISLPKPTPPAHRISIP